MKFAVRRLKLKTFKEIFFGWTADIAVLEEACDLPWGTRFADSQGIPNLQKTEVHESGIHARVDEGLLALAQSVF